MFGNKRERDDPAYDRSYATLGNYSAYRNYLKWDLGEHLSLTDLGARLTQRAKELLDGEPLYAARDAALMRAAARIMNRLQLDEIKQYGT